MNIEELKGEILTHIDIGDDEVMLTTKSGRKIKIYHSQDCCESVGIEGVEGDYHKLIGEILVDVSEEIAGDNPPYEHCESWTWTTHKFRTTKDTVIVKWIGTSNGYYSETVSIKDITK